MTDKHLTTAGELAQDAYKRWKHFDQMAKDHEWDGHIQKAGAYACWALGCKKQYEEYQALPPETVIPLFQCMNFQ